MKNIYIIGLIAVLIAVASAAFYLNGTENVKINNYDECAAAGYSVLESYPEQCKLPDGTTFTRQVNYSNDGLSIYKDFRTNEYACFGCNNKMCVDILIDENIEIVNETSNFYCDEDFNIVEKPIPTDIIKVEKDFGNKIVYDMNQNKDNLVIDCNARGGTFNECGSVCASDAEICTKQCALTCEDIN